MLFSQLNDMMKITFVAQAPVGQEWELLPQKTVTKCLSMKEDSGKFAAKLAKKQKEEDEAAGFEDKDWVKNCLKNLKSRKRLLKFKNTWTTYQGLLKTKQFL